MLEVKTEAMIDALMEAYRFGEVGRCVNSVTHDANNSLGVILAYSELVGMEQGIPDEAQRMLNEIAVATRRVSEQLSWLTEVARPVVAAKSTVRVSTLVDRAVALRHYELKHQHVDLRICISEDLPEVVVEVPAIERALIYVLANALDAVSDGDEKWIAVDGAAEAGGVNVHVRDSADPIPTDTAASMFEPLFTTKGGNHLGLGLHAARVAAEASGGSLAYAPGLGFTFSLPVS